MSITFRQPPGGSDADGPTSGDERTSIDGLRAGLSHHNIQTVFVELTNRAYKDLFFFCN
jgi:hypothetical protein